MHRLIALVCLSTLLSGCAGAVISAGTEVAATAMENRSAGRKVDDKLLYADVYNQFSKADRGDLIGKINLNTRFARVMLTGTVDKEEDARTAVALAWKAANIEEVINEITVKPGKDALDIANDSLVKRNLEARLLITKGVSVINYSLDIQNGVAYIIGRVKDQAELNRVLNVCRTTKGIKRVVSHLQINTNTDLRGNRTGTTTQAAPVGGVDIESDNTPAPVISGPIKAPPVPQDSTKRSF